MSEDGETRTSTECCCYKDGWGNGIDVGATSDPEFLRAVAIEVVRSQPVDPRRVYMAGHSNGCMTSLSMAAQHSDIVAAVCCHSGFPVTPVAEKYWPGVVNPWARDLYLMPVPSAAEYFADKNGCNLEEATTLEVDDGGISTKYSAKCDRKADVELVTMPNSGHSDLYLRYVPWVTAYYQSMAVT